MYNKFLIFQNKWLAENVKDDQFQYCNDWLLGKCDQTVTSNNQSSKFCYISTNEDFRKTPYRKFNKYKIY